MTKMSEVYQLCRASLNWKVVPVLTEFSSGYKIWTSFLMVRFQILSVTINISLRVTTGITDCQLLRVLSLRDKAKV